MAQRLLVALLISLLLNLPLLTPLLLTLLQQTLLLSGETADLCMRALFRRVSCCLHTMYSPGAAPDCGGVQASAPSLNAGSGKACAGRAYAPACAGLCGKGVVSGKPGHGGSLCSQMPSHVLASGRQPAQTREAARRQGVAQGRAAARGRGTTQGPGAVPGVAQETGRQGQTGGQPALVFLWLKRSNTRPGHAPPAPPRRRTAPRDAAAAEEPPGPQMGPGWSGPVLLFPSLFSPSPFPSFSSLSFFSLSFPPFLSFPSSLSFLFLLLSRLCAFV